MKQWFRIAMQQGVPAFVATPRNDIRELIARTLKPAEILKIPEADRNDDTRFEAYCRGLAKGDELLDAGEVEGDLDVGTYKFRFVAL